MLKLLFTSPRQNFSKVNHINLTALTIWHSTIRTIELEDIQLRTCRIITELA